MVKSVLQVASFVVAAGLSVPALAEAQAIPRTTSGSSSSSGSGGGGSTSSGSGGGGGVSAPAGGGGSGASSGGSVAPPPPAPSSSGGFGSDPSGSARTPSRTSGSTPTAAKNRGGGDARTAPGGVATGSAVAAGTSNVAGYSTSARTAPGSAAMLPVGAGSAGSRARGNRPVTGEATARPETALRTDLVAFPFFGPWGQWYPWYTGGFGWNAGYLGYSPWDYAGTCWQWGRYGPWYNPYSYCWDPLWSEPGYASGGSRSSAGGKPHATMGSLRLKVSPASAKVYVDGALVGTVDEFNGLNSHLDIEAGRRALELRADGFQNYTGEIDVAAGKTQTVRISMKKK